jgi:hypothetical protein
MFSLFRESVVPVKIDLFSPVFIRLILEGTLSTLLLSVSLEGSSCISKELIPAKILPISVYELNGPQFIIE